MSEGKTREETMLDQLIEVRARLASYPFSNHEAVCLRDCLISIIKTIAGEELQDGEVLTAGGVAQGSTDMDVIIAAGGHVLRGGRQVADGVIVYENPKGSPGAPLVTPMEPAQIVSNPLAPPPGLAPIGGQALIDVEASMPRAVPGSLMEAAQSGRDIVPPRPTLPGLTESKKENKSK